LLPGHLVDEAREAGDAGEREGRAPCHRGMRPQKAGRRPVRRRSTGAGRASGAGGRVGYAGADRAKERSLDDIARMDAVGQAGLVRAGELSARELVEAAIARIERVDPELNAAVVRLYVEGRASAAAASGPLAGVPFLLKDVGARQAGLPYTAG